MSHLSKQVGQLFVDLGPEGGACYTDECLSVHFPSHLQLLKSSCGFMACCLKTLGNDSWMEALQ